MSDTTNVTARPLPTWLVSARNGWRDFGPGRRPSKWRPYGVQHARQVGALLTACGEPAADWEMFWDLPFPAEPRLTCSDCRREVQLGRKS
jgi:hypothetical protein